MRSAPASANAVASAATGEVKGSYLNVTGATMEDIYERAEFAKELGSVVIMLDLVIGWSAIQSMANWARKNDMIVHMHRAGHGTYTRQKNHGVSFRVIAKWLRLAGVDHLHTGTAVGKLEGDPMTVQGYYNVCRDSYTKQDLPRGLFFDQDWCDTKKVSHWCICPAWMPPEATGIILRSPAQSCSKNTPCSRFCRVTASRHVA